MLILVVRLSILKQSQKVLMHFQYGLSLQPHRQFILVHREVGGLYKDRLVLQVLLVLRDGPDL